MATYSGAPSFELFYVEFSNLSADLFGNFSAPIYICAPGEQVAVLNVTIRRTGGSNHFAQRTHVFLRPLHVNSAGNYEYTTSSGVEIGPLAFSADTSTLGNTSFFDDPFLGNGRAISIGHQQYRIDLAFFQSTTGTTRANGTYSGRALMKRYKSL